MRRNESEGTKAINQCQEPLVSCDRRAWIEATSSCCGQRREIRVVKCRGTNAGTADGEPCRLCNHTAWDFELDLRENIEMIGEREIMIDILLLPEMSRAERARQAKKMNNSHFPALRLRSRCKAAPLGEAASWLHWKGKVSFIACFLLYPASRVPGRGPAGLGKPKLLLYSIWPSASASWNRQPPTMTATFNTLHPHP
jgi:hypothetical protein